MSKKNHKSHASHGNHGRNEHGPSAVEAITDETPSSSGTFSSIRSTLEDGIDKGVEVAKGAVAGAKEVAHDVADKMETMAHDVQETISEAGQAVVETAKKNPVGLALAGIGVACAGVGVTMLMLNGGGTASAGSGKRKTGAQSGNGTAKGKPQQRLAERAQSSIQGATRSAGKAVESVMAKAKVQGRRVGSSLQDTYESNPLAVGAAVVAAGTIVGLAMPMTKRENQWLGEGSDQVAAKAKELVTDAIDKVDHLLHPGSGSSTTPARAEASAKT